MPRACGIDQRPRLDALPPVGLHGHDLRLRDIDRAHLRMNELHTALTRLSSPPVEQRGAVEIAFVLGVPGSQQDIVRMQSRKLSVQCIAIEQPCADTEAALQSVSARQLGREFGVTGQIQIAEARQRDRWYTLIAAQVVTEVFDVVDTEL